MNTSPGKAAHDADEGGGGGVPQRGGVAAVGAPVVVEERERERVQALKNLCYPDGTFKRTSVTNSALNM